MCEPHIIAIHTPNDHSIKPNDQTIHLQTPHTIQNIFFDIIYQNSTNAT